MGKIKKDSEKDAKYALLDEIFDELYMNRRRVYQVNFFRGIFFGLGSVLGGTVVVAVVVWILSFFVQLPGIGEAFEEAQNTIESSKSR